MEENELGIGVTDIVIHHGDIDKSTGHEFVMPTPRVIGVTTAAHDWLTQHGWGRTNWIIGGPQYDPAKLEHLKKEALEAGFTVRETFPPVPDRVSYPKLSK